MEELTMSPVREDPIIMDFPSCIDELAKGKKCRRQEWKDERIYITMDNEKLVIYKPGTKKFHPLIVSLGDMSGMDWMVVE